MYELWFRAPYEPDLRSRKFSSAIRPGNRTPGNDKGVEIGETVKVRVLEYPGLESLKLDPVFTSFEINVRITKGRVLRIDQLTEDDLRNCSPDVRDPRMVKYHLGLIYNRIFENEEKVTLLSWEYL